MSMSFFNTHHHMLGRREFLASLSISFGALVLPCPTAPSVLARTRPSFIEGEVEHARRIIMEERFCDVLSNRYLASALYYSERFLSRVAQPMYQVDTPSTIIGRISTNLSTRFRQGAFAFLSTAVDRELLISSTLRLPLQRFSFGHGQNHADAVDLFAREGSQVSAHADGIVLLADCHWQADDSQSAASLRGGNTVITYNPLRGELCRYAHLRTVATRVGQLVLSGERIGTVGNSGTNAVRPGHGGHLHFEINQHNQQLHTNRSVSSAEIQQRLRLLL
jgi:murein DD-endopeptidase MepM/ murein hydrolase activator NlpD